MNLARVDRLDRGLVTAVSPVLHDPGGGSSIDLLNMNFSDLGMPKKRPGVAPLTIPSPGGVVTSMHQYVNPTTGVRYLVAAHGDNLSVWDPEAGESGEWDNLSTQDAIEDHPPSIITFDGMMIAGNGTMHTVKWDSESTTTTTLFPYAKYLSVYRNRVVAAGFPDDPYLLNLSTTGSHTQFDPDEEVEEGVVVNSVKAYVGIEDGHQITGLLNIGEGGMLIGKTVGLYGLFGYARKNFIIEKLDANIGVISHRTMQYIRPAAYFVGGDGIYKYELGGDPIRISAPIQDKFDYEINHDRLDESTAVYLDEQYVVVLPEGESDFTTWVFHTGNETWSIWSEPKAKTSCQYFDGATQMYFADAEGDLFQMKRGQLYDEYTLGGTKSAIRAYLHTSTVGAQDLELDKDLSDLYLSLMDDGEPVYVGVEVYLSYKDPIVQEPGALVGGTGEPGVQVLRIVVGQTTRFFSVKMFNNEVGQDFRPLSLSYKYEPKDVL